MKRLKPEWEEFMSQKSIKKNYIFNVAYQILTLITPLITAPYLSRVLRPDGVGTISFAESVVSYFSLIAVMGISTYGQREISYVQDDIEKRSEVFWNAKILNFCTSGITLVIYIVFALFQKENRLIYLLLSLNIVSVFFDITWFFQGMEDFAKTVARNAVFKIVQIVYIFLFVKSRDDLARYVFGQGFFVALGNVSLWAYLPRYIHRVSLSKLSPFKDIKVVWSLFIPTVAMYIYTVLDKTMIGVITKNSFENGYYEQAIKISKMLLAVVTALGTVMVPRIGFLFGKSDVDKLNKYMYRSYHFVWFLGIPMCFGLIMVAGNMVPWFFGEGYEQVIPLLQILSVLILAIGMSNVTGTQYLVPTKRQKQFTASVIMGAVSNFCLNAILIYFFGALGAAVASVIAESVVTAIQLWFIRRELSPLKILKEGINSILAGTIMMLVLLPIVRRFTPSLIHTMVIVLVGAITYILALILEKDEFLLTNVGAVWHRLKKNE